MISTRLSMLAITLLLVTCACSLAFSEDKVSIELTYPNGSSPKVFTTGWTFGAKATINPGTKGAKDISKQVKWSGSGLFNPGTGAKSHPLFTREGDNTIELSVVVGKKKYSEKFEISAVKPNHATIGDKAYCAADAHACMACPHPVIGPIVSGNSKVRINGKPVACVGDTGVHAACCGPNTFKIVSGDPNVLVDGKPVARKGDKTQHCGGIGKIVDSSFTISTKFSGRFSGGATGNATFTVEPGNVAGKFRGGHASEGGGTVNVELDGTYNPKNGSAKGTMTGTATYVGLSNQTSTASVTGSFKGTTKGNTFKGTWSVTAKGLSSKKVNGSFSTTRSGK